jgi:fructuronate reductase
LITPSPDHPLAAQVRAATRPRTRRLSHETLQLVRARVELPRFDPRALRPGILHLGCGVFHRAHQALMTQRAIEAEMSAMHPPLQARVPAWGIVSTSLRTRDAIESLKAQSGLYCVLERGPQRMRIQVVGSLRHLAFVPEEPETVATCFEHAAIRILTLTVSPAGYCLDPATQRLDPSHPDIAHDLRAPSPRSAPGLLVRGLAQRRANGLPPPVVLSCDNMPGNGHVLRQACIDFAALQDDGLAQWIATHAQFPCTMVDRIVPAPTRVDRADASAALGLVDAMPVSSEPYCQWVIERFDGPRPRWDVAGAEYVDDVRPWEAAKLRLLNGGHLALAYVGLLAGFETVADAIDHPDLLGYMLRFMLDEQRPTLPPSGHDIAGYAQQLVRRWRNRGITDSLSRVGRDGSVKLPARLLASLQDNLAAGRPAPCTVLAVAAWMRCATGHDGRGRRLSLPDPMADRLRRRTQAAGDDPERLVDACLGIREVFDRPLAGHPALRHALVRSVAALQAFGAVRAAAACADGSLP